MEREDEIQKLTMNLVIILIFCFGVTFISSKGKNKNFKSKLAFFFLQI